MMFRPCFMAIACIIASSSVANEPTSRHDYPRPNWIRGEGPMLPIISKDRMVVSVYSSETSKWAQVQLESPLPEDVLLTNQSGFVVFQTKDVIYAINATGTQWDRLTFVGKHNKTFDMNDEFVISGDERGLFVFGRKATKWRGINLTTGELLNLESGEAN